MLNCVLWRTMKTSLRNAAWNAYWTPFHYLDILWEVKQRISAWYMWRSMATSLNNATGNMYWIESHYIYIPWEVKQPISASCTFNYVLCHTKRHQQRSTLTSLKTKFMGPTWGPSGADRTQVDPMLAPWALLSGLQVMCTSKHPV